MYDDKFDRIRNDRDGSPIGDEETVRQEMLAAENDKDKTEDLESEELEDSIEEEEEDEPESRQLTITIKGKFFSIYSATELKSLVQDAVEEFAEADLEVAIED